MHLLVRLAGVTVPGAVPAPAGTAQRVPVAHATRAGSGSVPTAAPGLIDRREVPLATKHTELYDTFKDRK